MLLLRVVEVRLPLCVEEGCWPELVVLLLLAQEELVVCGVGGEERLLAEWDGCSLEVVLVPEAGGGGEACPFRMFMRWWRRHLARLLENQT